MGCQHIHEHDPCEREVDHFGWGELAVYVAAECLHINLVESGPQFGPFAKLSARRKAESAHLKISEGCVHNFPSCLPPSH